MDNKSEFLMNSLFQCQNSACHCEKDIENVAPGVSPKTTLKLHSDTTTLLYSYAAGTGLNLTGVAGGIIEKNILGKLRALPSDSIDQHIDFFEKFGFFFPLKQDEYDAVDADSIISVTNHIKSTMRLMNAIATKDYKSILINTTYLLYSQPVTIKLAKMTYTTCMHPFTEYVNKYAGYPDLTRDSEAFKTGKHTFADTLTENGNPLDMSFYDAVQSGTDSGIAGTRDPYFKRLFAMYTGLAADAGLRTMIDFFYHYQTEVGVFKDISYGHITYYSKAEENFTDTMKSALIKIARIVISEEINHNISGIHPVYNRGLVATWQVDTFMQALYFSIFYMKAGIEIYKECKNPNCKRDKYFLVEATRSNKDYCCVQCARAAAAQRYRANHPKNQQ